MPGFRAAGSVFIVFGLIDYLADMKVYGVIVIAAGVLFLWLNRRTRQHRGTTSTRHTEREELP